MNEYRTVTAQQVEESLQPVPEDLKGRGVLNQFWIWCGANVAPIIWVLGALGIQLGLSLKETILVIVVGNAIGMPIFGFMVLLGPKSSSPSIVLSRYALGRRGNYLVSVVHTLIMFLWLAVNTWVVLDLIMALLGALGVVDPSSANVWPKVTTGVLLMAVQVFIALAGYRFIAAFERWTVPIAMVVMVAMTIGAWVFMGIHWNYPGVSGHILRGAAKWAAMSSIMTAIGIGWGMTWFMYATDYSRFVVRDVSKVKLFCASVIGQFLPAVWLGILGATLATRSVTTDPGELIVKSFGVFAIPVLFLVVHGPIATNILNIYSGSLSVQATDLRVSRRWVTVALGIAGVAVMLVFVLNSNLGNVLNTFLSATVTWLAPWGGVMFAHYYWVHRGEDVPVRSLFAGGSDSPLPAVNWAGCVALLAGIGCAWVFTYGGVGVLQGPGSRALGGVDLSWLVGLVVSALVYALLGPLCAKAGAARIAAYERSNAA